MSSTCGPGIIRLSMTPLCACRGSTIIRACAFLSHRAAILVAGDSAAVAAGTHSTRTADPVSVFRRQLGHTILAGLIALSREVLYPHYQTALRLWDLTPQEDQIGGGIVMFAVGSTTYAIAILILINALLSEGRRRQSTKRTLSDGAKKVEGRI